LLCKTRSAREYCTRVSAEIHRHITFNGVWRISTASVQDCINREETIMMEKIASTENRNQKALYRLKRLTLLIVPTLVVLGLAGCGSSGGGDGGSKPFQEGTYRSVTVVPKVVVIRDDTTTVTLNKSEPFSSAINFSEAETGISITPRECAPPSDTCEQWDISAASSVPPGTYYIEVGAVAGDGSFESLDDFWLTLISPMSGPRGAVSLTTSIGASLSGSATFARTASGQVWAWGDNDHGTLGLGYLGIGLTQLEGYNSVAVQAMAGQDFVDAGFYPSAVQAVAAGSRHTLALLADGTVWAWGENDGGQLGDGTGDLSTDPIDHISPPVQVIGIADVQAIAAAGTGSLALLADGTVWAWGSAVATNLSSSSTPLEVNNLANVQAIAAGGDDFNSFSLALLANGTVWAWGQNDFGQLGDGTTIRRDTPVQVSGLTDVQAIATGQDHSLALLADGTVRAWGVNNNGKLGDGTQIDRRTPVQVSGLANVQAVAAGNDHSLALLDDGTVWAWGDNYYGELGDGTKRERRTPVQVGGLANVQAIAAGWANSYAIGPPACDNGGGKVWAWGDYRPELGTGWIWDIYDQRSTAVLPVPVPGFGDKDSCASNRIVFYLTGTGHGTIESDSGTIQCNTTSTPVATSTPIEYCRLETTATSVHLTAMPDGDSAFESWRWECAANDPAVDVNFTGGDSELLCEAVFNLSGNPPEAAFTFTPAQPQSGQQVDFDASDSSDDGTITTYQWDFQDDGIFDGTGVASSFTFTTIGTYTVRLRVTDNEGLTTDTTQTVAVTLPASDYTLTLIIQGGPGAGEILSGEAPVPLMDCVNSDTPSTTCTATYSSNPQVFAQLTASPFGDNTTVNWSGCLDFGGLNCTVLMDGDRTVTATFQ